MARLIINNYLAEASESLFEFACVLSGEIQKFKREGLPSYSMEVGDREDFYKKVRKLESEIALLDMEYEIFEKQNKREVLDDA